MPNHSWIKLALTALLVATLACSVGLPGAGPRAGTPGPGAATPLSPATVVPGAATQSSLATAAPPLSTPAAGPTAGRPVPVTTHPRLWLTAADLPRLRSWPVASNPVFQNGLAVAAANAKADMDSNLAGLERRVRARESLETVHSVASFFVSRVDTEVDKRLRRIDLAKATLSCWRFTAQVRVIISKDAPIS